MIRKLLKRLSDWLLEIEMGVVWGVAGISIIAFIFAAIWYIDPALLTLVLKFRGTQCRTVRGDFLIGINNCSWTSCRLGCTKDVYRCWQITVEYNSSVDELREAPPVEETRLYPNVRGCGYPPELNCEEFFSIYGTINKTFPCWISQSDNKIALTVLDLKRAKKEVLLSLIPLFVFIVFVLYAFCRLGVFSICNPTKHCCPRANDAKIDIPSLTPKKLFDYKKSLIEKRDDALLHLHQFQGKPHEKPQNNDSLSPIQETAASVSLGTQTSLPSPPADVRRRGFSPTSLYPSSNVQRVDSVDDIIRAISFDDDKNIQILGEETGLFKETSSDYMRRGYPQNKTTYSKLKQK